MLACGRGKSCSHGSGVLCVRAIPTARFELEMVLESHESPKTMEGGLFEGGLFPFARPPSPSLCPQRGEGGVCKKAICTVPFMPAVRDTMPEGPTYNTTIPRSSHTVREQASLLSSSLLTAVAPVPRRLTFKRSRSPLLVFAFPS